MNCCFPMTNPQSIRDEMGRVMPIYQGIEKLKKEGDHLQWGGPYLHKDGHFTAMPNSRALFSVLNPPDRRAAAGKFYLATRRGKQFNSMTFGADRPADGNQLERYHFHLAEDAKHLGIDKTARGLSSVPTPEK